MTDFESYLSGGLRFLVLRFKFSSLFSGRSGWSESVISAVGGGVDLSRRLPRTYSLPSISITYDKLSFLLDMIVAVLSHLSDV